MALLANVADRLSAEDAAPVSFNRDIRPILSDACFQCHGPDESKRQADLRLDSRQAALAGDREKPLLVPGRPEESELYRRIRSTDPDERMPLAEGGRPLSEAQIDRIRRWISQGAAWEEHWSFVTPVRPAVPAVRDAAWPQGPMDQFVLARLEREGLAPSAPADSETVIRRVTLDLTGLPPTPAEVDAFLADRSPDAYERVVDRLLASARGAEQIAAAWLDAARYADTSGYQNDGPRHMWRWRDWVLGALAAGMPFDRFTLEQVAGDLLPSPSLEQRIATGFNRNHRGNAEGGIIPEEYAVEYVVDRVDTTSTVWLGLTIGCARCHDHKYDPVTQKEFYQLFGYFNNVPEHGRAIKEGNSPPFIPAPSREQQARLSELEYAILQGERRAAQLEPALQAALSKWERSANVAAGVEGSIDSGLAAHFRLDGDGLEQTGACRPARFVGPPDYRAGRMGQAARLDGQRFLEAGDLGRFGYFDQFSLAAWIRPEGPSGTIVSRMTDVEEGDGYSVGLKDGRIAVHLVKRWLDDAVRVETEPQLSPGRWHHVMVTYDGSRVAKGIGVYIDGRLQTLRVHLDALNQSFTSSEPLRIGAGGGPSNRFVGDIDEVKVYEVCLSPHEVMIAAEPDSIAAILRTPRAMRSQSQREKLRAYFLGNHAPAEIRRAHERLLFLHRDRQRLLDEIPTVMVMEEMSTPRDTFMLIRGEYDRPGPRVDRGVPASLPGLPVGGANDRLGLARWLVDSSHPLTARVTVNRYWQALFGAGLVRTTEDFGSQGERPSHPDLLDWLATRFIESGWDVKGLHRSIVTSATYRQSSAATPRLLARDPENRLLARGPRVRLSAQAVRDQALAASGLLVERMGGPSVKPDQPEGLWKEIATDTEYQPDEGAGLYRRSLYTYWKRTVGPPTMMAFDASPRETCTVRQVRTNTPLQALALLNDVTFVEAARLLAERGMKEGGSTPAERIEQIFRLATGRRPRSEELEILVAGLREHWARYQSDPRASLEILEVGHSPPDPSLDPAELAAYTILASSILNLDEVVTKG